MLQGVIMGFWLSASKDKHSGHSKCQISVLDGKLIVNFGVVDKVVDKWGYFPKIGKIKDFPNAWKACNFNLAREGT